MKKIRSQVGDFHELRLTLAAVNDLLWHEQWLRESHAQISVATGAAESYTSGQYNKVGQFDLGVEGNGCIRADYANNRLFFEEAGRYFVSANVWIGTVATNMTALGLGLKLNNSSYELESGVYSAGSIVLATCISGIQTFDVDDYLEMWVYPTFAGGPVNFTSQNGGRTLLSATRIL